MRLVVLVAVIVAMQASAFELQSPDGRIVLRFDASSRPVYSVSFNGKPVLADSRIGFVLADGSKLCETLEVQSTSTSSHDSSWKPVYGERSTIRDHYNELVVKAKAVDLVFRCYNEGAAFHYLIKGTGKIEVKNELTDFRFQGDHPVWCTTSAQGAYSKKPISGMGKHVERPMTAEVAGDVFAAVAEARLVDFARMKLAKARRKNTVAVELGSSVTAQLPLKTPWRVIMLADSPGRLLENNDIILNLNDPCAIKDTSWIKPGKVIREVTLTTVGAKICVDFAAKRKIEYVEFDAGWYGHEYDNKSDATSVTVDPRRSQGPLDLHEIIRYARERGIGIILYVNRRCLERQLDDILPLYKSWGVAGIKYGFVNVGTQYWTTWLHEAVRKTAKYKLMVDIHDEYRPTGYSRTYPNLMTQEGIRGDETKPDNPLTMAILFNRMLAGAGDNTICYYDKRVDENATHAYQLAKAVCFYCPWQFIYWYDRPKAPGRGGNISDEPELEFYDHCPTVWDDTNVIHGKIGVYAVIARRSGRQWYIGGMNSGQARTLDVPLGFLKSKVAYTAHIYTDDPTVKTRTHVAIERRKVTSASTLQIPMGKQGGYAVRLVPTK